MRRLVLITLLLAFIPTAQSQSEDSVFVPLSTIKINPYAWTHPSVFYEYGFAQRHAFEASIGGAPQGGFLSGAHPANMLFGTLSYRWYVAQWRHFHLFLSGGGCFLYTWGTYDLYNGSDGWDIRTRTYHYSDHRIAPTFGYGFRIPAGRLFIEFIALIPLTEQWHQTDNDNGIISDTKTAFGISQQICIKLGLTF